MAVKAEYPRIEAEEKTGRASDGQSDGHSTTVVGSNDDIGGTARLFYGD
jgi:hypothetical protein